MGHQTHNLVFETGACKQIFGAIVPSCDFILHPSLTVHAMNAGTANFTHICQLTSPQTQRVACLPKRLFKPFRNDWQGQCNSNLRFTGSRNKYAGSRRPATGIRMVHTGAGSTASQPSGAPKDPGGGCDSEGMRCPLIQVTCPYH